MTTTDWIALTAVIAAVALVWWDTRRRWRTLDRSLREHLEREARR